MRIKILKDGSYYVCREDLKYATFQTIEEAWGEILAHLKPGEIIALGPGVQLPQCNLSTLKPWRHPVTEIEIEKLADELSRKLEPRLESLIEESLTTCLEHLGSEMKIFAEMRRTDRRAFLSGKKL